MAFRKYLLDRLWVLPLMATLAFIGIDTGIHYGVTQRVSDRHVFQPPMEAGDSPTGYQFDQRDAILPYTGMDGYHWIMQTQDMLAKGDGRVRWVNYDNYDGGPKGREVHWSSSFRWWVSLLAWIEHTYTGVPLPLAVEDVMPYANTLLISLLLIPLAPFVTRRFGIGPGSIMLLGMAAILPLYESFSEGKSDHHGLAALSTLLTLLFLLGGGAGWVRTEKAASLTERFPILAWLPERTQARRWFIASGIVGGIGLWVSTASEAPVLAEIGVAALVATGWLGYGASTEDGARPDPSLWRVWGWAGAATSVFFYFLEYFPAHFGLRLEVNHPLYAAAWAGGGEIVYRICRWWNGGKLAERATDWLWLGLSVLGVITAPALIFLFADKVFWVADRFLFLFHEDYIAEFKDVRRYLDPMYTTGSAKYMFAVLNPVALLAVPMVVWMWRQLRVPILIVAALLPPAYDVFRLVLFVIPATRTHYPMDNFFWVFAGGLAVTTVALLCLFWQKWEKQILLGTLAAGLWIYNLLLLSWEAWAAGHPQECPLDYYFWPSLMVPIVIILGLLAHWDPWPEFPRPAKALILLSLPPALITLALSVREMRWMEQDYSLWLATLVGMAVVLGHLRAYRWPGLWLGIGAGLGVLFPLETLRVILNQAFVSASHPEAEWLAYVPWLSALFAVVVVLCVFRRGQTWKVVARTFAAIVFLGAVLLPSAVLTMADWVAWWGATPISDVELMEILTRDASHRLRAQLGDETGVVVSGPTTTTWMSYWGNFYGLGTLYWENLEGLKADRDIYAAQTPEEALKLIKERGVTHIAIFSWDPFYKEYARLAINRARPYNPDEYIAEKPLRNWLDRTGLIKATKSEVEDEKPLLRHAFIYSLMEAYDIPTWLRPVYYPMPADKQLNRAFILIFEVVPNQTPEEAAVRRAQFELQRGNAAEVIRQINIAITLHPDYLPALICAANFDHSRNSLGEFVSIMQRIRALLPMADTLSLEDRLDLATDFVQLREVDHQNRAADLTIANDEDTARRQIAACLPLVNHRNLRRLSTDQQYHLLSFLRQTGMLDARPGVAGFIQTLLPNNLRALFLFESGQSAKLTNPAAALALLQRSLAWQPESVSSLCEIARIMATSKVDSLRNPHQALVYALQARDKDGGHNADSADALACAYAANSQFELAEKLETEAMQIAQSSHADGGVLAVFRTRIDLFHNKLPLIE